MDLKMLKGMSLEDLLNLDYTQLKENEVAYVEKRLIKTVNQRINKLKQSGMISRSKLTTSEKKGLKPVDISKRTRVTRGGKTVSVNIRNKLIKASNKARNILLKKTSKESGISEQDQRYKDVISKTLGHEVKLDKRRLRRVNKLMKKAQEYYELGQTNKKFTGSPYILQTIVDIVKSRDYITNDKAETIIQEAVDNGYESAMRMMKQLLEEDSEGLDVGSSSDE